MQHTEYVDHLVAELGALVATVESADLTTPVPTCGSWDLAKLLKHVGTVHRWSMVMVHRLAQERVDPRTLMLGVPEDAAQYPAWIAEGGEKLVSILRDADPDAPMFAWGVDQHVRFWSRRMLHETVVHHADARLALGLPVAFDPTVALDAVDEFLENLPKAAGFNPLIRELAGTGETIHLHATDADGEWMITRGADGFTWAHGHGKGDVAVRGPITDLALLVYARRSPADPCFELFGDTALVDHWLAHSAL